MLYPGPCETNGRFDSTARAGQLLHAQESPMYHAEDALKRLPALARLAAALRRIPAIGLAFTKLRTLLHGRTNVEPVITSEFVATTPDAIGEAVGTDTSATDTVEVDAAHPGSVETEPVGTDVVEIGLVEVDAVGTETVGGD